MKHWRLFIATGGKFVWGDETYGGTVIKRGIESEIFGRNRFDKGKKTSHPQERKKYFGILATPAKGGWYIDAYAESITPYDGDSYYYKNGVLNALRDVNSKQQAQDMLLAYYYKNIEDEAKMNEQQVPF